MKEIVSVIIPTYKRSLTLKRAIDSVTNQTYSNIEVLVVDDNDQETIESKYVKDIIQEYNNDKRVRYIGQEHHVNGAVARNVGIKNAQGKYITFLDDDDEWENSKVEKQVQFLEKNPNIGGVSCLYTVMKNEKEIRRCELYDTNDLHKKVIRRDIAVFTSTIMLRKDRLDLSGYFNESLLRHQDLQLLLDFLYINKIEVLPYYLVKLHADSEINHPNVNKLICIKKDFFHICEKHLKMYSKKEQRNILAAHYFEIIVTALKEKKIFLAFKYLLKINININAYIQVVRRYNDRKKGANRV